MMVGGDAAEREGKSYWGMSGRPCDSCSTALALLFCRADSAFLCLACDAEVHGANRLASRHERVWMCEVCEQAPAAVTCKADAAALCAACDADIHSANPLARRHERVPVAPFFGDGGGAVAGGGGAGGGGGPAAEKALDVSEADEEELLRKAEEDEEEAESWLIPDMKVAAAEEQGLAPKESEIKAPAAAQVNNNKVDPSAAYFFSDVDPYLDLDYASSMDKAPRFHGGHQMDSVVPVQTATRGVPVASPFLSAADFDFPGSKHSYSYGQSLSHSVSSSEVGVVPDGSSLGDVSKPYVTGVPANPAAVMGQAAGLAVPTVPATGGGMDREARVMRYREKRKNRKFEKTIRYASRKAYAETRPRVKGRFAKRTEVDHDNDDCCTDSAGSAVVGGPDVGYVYGAHSGAAGLMVDAAYGVVPSF